MRIVHNSKELPQLTEKAQKYPLEEQSIYIHLLILLTRGES
jgi:hypothetical protein